mgnify:CR=1 FL=1
MTTITVGSAVDLIDSAIVNFEDGLDSNSISNLIHAVNNHLQVRDYLIGLPANHEIEKCVEFLSYLSKSIDEQDRFAVDTVNAMYQYELENLKKSIELLANAQAVNPEYSLANLVTRAIQAGWPSNAFAKMRNELAHKVVENITEQADEVIE